VNEVLVLLAVYNGKAWISAQMESILAQQGVGIRVLIGDDCSTDGGVERLLADIDDGRRIQATRFSSPSGGAGQSFLRLLCDADLSSIEFLSFSDQDDIWHADKLARAIAMLKSSNADGYSAAVTAFWPSDEEQLLVQSTKITDMDFFFEGAGQGCTFVLRADFARRVQKFVRDNRELLARIHYHDWFCYVCARAFDKGWYFDPEPSMRYRQHGGNDTGARSALAGLRKRLSLIRNGWYADQVRQMLMVAYALNPGVIPGDFHVIWKQKAGFQRRIKLALILFRRGRRRPSDRLVLMVAALMGWL
jgi:rhamnosyltransferase